MTGYILLTSHLQHNSGQSSTTRGHECEVVIRLTTDMMGMGTPKIDGSVEPNSWLQEKAETQCDLAQLGEFTFDWQPNRERHYDSCVYMVITSQRAALEDALCVAEMLF